MRSRSVVCSVVWSVAAPLAAQVGPDETILVTAVAGGPFRTQLLAVDPAANITPFGRFAADAAAPQALAVDPYDRELLVAVEATVGARVVRLSPRGRALGSELTLATLPGPCRQLAVLDDQVIALVDGAGGGVFTMDRRSPSIAAQLLALPRAAALHSFGPAQPTLVLGWSQDPTVPGAAPGVGYADLPAGTFSFGPFSFVAPSGTPMTGLADLPTGVPRQLLSFADGTFLLHVTGTAQPVTPSPPIPSGGANAMHSEAGGLAAIGLGGSSFPHLYRIDAFTGAVTVLTGALPGDPVDFALPTRAGASALSFGQPCNAPRFALAANGSPHIGTPGFALRATAAPSSPLLFAAGLSDTLAGVLPFPLPGGCPLHVDPMATTLTLTDPVGTATLPLPIPAASGLIGAIAFAQALQLPAGVFASSPALVLQIGP